MRIKRLLQAIQELLQIRQGQAKRNRNAGPEHRRLDLIAAYVLREPLGYGGAQRGDLVRGESDDALTNLRGRRIPHLVRVPRRRRGSRVYALYRTPVFERELMNVRVGDGPGGHLRLSPTAAGETIPVKDTMSRRRSARVRERPPERPQGNRFIVPIVPQHPPQGARHSSSPWTGNW